MTIADFKRRSINLDDGSYNRGKLLARKKVISLSALLRLLIYAAYEQQEEISQQPDVGRSCS
jgi:hypothetical protein